MIRRPPRSTLFPYTSSSDLHEEGEHGGSRRRRQKRLGERQERRANEQHAGQLERDDEHAAGGGGENDGLVLFRPQPAAGPGPARPPAYPHQRQGERGGTRRPPE